jgi:3-oxoacyl-[acyl-carrier-protein] synthase-1
MAAIAIKECLSHINRDHWHQLPLLLCVADRERPGRLNGLEDELFPSIEDELEVRFSAQSRIIPYGRVSLASALMEARRLIYQRDCPAVLIAGTDSMLRGRTLVAYEQNSRLLTDSNPNGFMPGEAGGALLVGPAQKGRGLNCVGVGLGGEEAHIRSDQPLRGDGLIEAIRNALLDANCQLHDIDLRITDISGEQYYFKEAALALTRLLRVRKEEFDIWHPADCIGECGAVVGIAAVATAHAACGNHHMRRCKILLHMANDNEKRCAVVLDFDWGP